MKLFIVESPGKIKTLEKILGSGYTVKASFGHLYHIWPDDKAIDVSDNYTPKIIAIEDKKKVIADLKAACDKADEIYLASDLDREGEAISYYIYDRIISDKSKAKRVRFNSITKPAILEAIKSAGSIDINLYNAQKARSVLDFLTGYRVSPVLWKKVCKGTSAGRVQSIGLRFIVDRQREIDAFKPDEYWSIKGLFSSGCDQTLEADYVIEGKVTNETKASEIAAAIKKESSWKIESIKRSPRKQSPPPLFITSSLQQFGSSYLGWDGKKVMSVAQKLYEGFPVKGDQIGLITYMRTDSVNISKEALEAVRGHITDKWGKDYLPDSPRVYKAGKSAQEAHEGIRPTHLEYSLQDIRNSVSAEAYSLYEIIYGRFVACQMADAEFDTSKVTIKSGEHAFTKTGQVLKFDGYLKAWTHSKVKDEDLPVLVEGSSTMLIKITPEQHFTKPPARFNPGSLVDALEKKGIGRPSTYASIVETILTRGYIEKVDKAFAPTELGCMVSDFLVVAFPELMDAGFTARVEAELDDVAEKGTDWVKTVDFFFKEIDKRITASRELPSFKKSEETEIVCPKCGKFNLIKRRGRFGWFYGCLGYMEKDGKKRQRACDGIFKIGDEGQPIIKAPPRYLEVDGKKIKCVKCGKPVVIRTGGKSGKEFGGCSSYPKCRQMYDIDGTPKEFKPSRFKKKL